MTEQGAKNTSTKPPLDRETLRRMYVDERKGGYEIARELGCTQWRVMKWLKVYKIPSRKPWEYPNGMTGNTHTPEVREKLRRLRLEDGHVPYLVNGVHYLKGKRGPEVPNWKGGITPERQAFYGTLEWRRAERKVKKRDGYSCQMCGRDKKGHPELSFDIHHIVSFECKELRAEVTNLVYLCEPCHYWVHGPENKKKLFVKEAPVGSQASGS